MSQPAVPPELMPRPGLVTDNTWVRAVRALPPEARSEVLAAADTLQTVGRVERRAALATYRALQSLLDPGDGLDAARINWTGEQLRYEDEGREWVEQLEQVSIAGPSLVQRLSAQIVLARMAEHHGDREVAEQRFRDVVIAARKVGGRVEREAVANLARLYLVSERLFEALVLTRRNLDRTRESEDAEGEAHVLLQLTRIYLDLGDPDHAEKAFQAALPIIADLGLENTRDLRLMAHGARARLHIARKEAEKALVAIDAAAAIEGDATLQLVDPRLGPLLRVRALQMAGRFDEAEPTLAGLRLMKRPGVAINCEIAEQGARFDHQRGDVAKARATVADVIDELEGVSRGATGSGWRIRMLGRLGSFAEKQLQDAALADRARELASRTVFERAVELEECLRDLPEIAEAGSEDLQLLRDYRRRFAADHADLLAAVARSWEARLARGEVPLEALIEDSGMMRVCAWCERVGLPGGRWLPMQTFLPNAAPVHVTHGICPDCLARFEAGSRAGKDTDPA